MSNLVWFKRDLRLHDHAALWHAQQKPIIALYIFEPDYWALSDTSQRQWAFTREALLDLDQQLQRYGGRLLCMAGRAEHCLNQLLDHLDTPVVVHSHEETGNLWTYDRDKRIKALLRERSDNPRVEWNEYPQNGVKRPNGNRDNWAQHWNTWMTQLQFPAPDALSFVPLEEITSAEHSDFIFTAEQLPVSVPCSLPEVHQPQTGGRTAGLAVMNDFLNQRGEYYRGSISSPLTAENGCSRLSPYLALGCIGMRELVQAVRNRRRTAEGRWKASLSAFESRLWWHCHFIQKLEDQPDMEVHNLHPLTEQLDRPFDEEKFEAWKTGNTGWPMVDASMRYLIANGWVNFRMRAMLISIASYPLALPWQPVSRYLASLFTDYEPGIHYPQVQMQAGTTGINIPRMYNPILQAQRLDAKGLFVRRWIPELQQVSDQWIFEPWLMPRTIQENARCILNKDYPAPLVDFSAATRKARADLKAVRDSDFFATAQSIGEKHGSRKRSSNRRMTGKKKARDAGQMTLF